MSFIEDLETARGDGFGARFVPPLETESEFDRRNNPAIQTVLGETGLAGADIPVAQQVEKSD